MPLDDDDDPLEEVSPLELDVPSVVRLVPSVELVPDESTRPELVVSSVTADVEVLRPSLAVTLIPVVRTPDDPVWVSVVEPPDSVGSLALGSQLVGSEPQPTVGNPTNTINR